MNLPRLLAVLLVSALLLFLTIEALSRIIYARNDLGDERV